jgi:23S rRNA (adenine-N6)-dimethyltransferase
VARKYLGKPKESLKSLLLKTNFEPTILFHLKPTDFWPRPSVNTCLIRFRRRKVSLIPQNLQPEWKNFLQSIFNRGKPTLKKSLEPWVSHEQFKRLAKDLNIEQKATVTEINLDQWLGLFDGQF